MTALAAFDRRLVEEGALAALEYGKRAPERRPLEEAVERLRFLVETAGQDVEARIRWGIHLGDALRVLGERAPDGALLCDAVETLRSVAGAVERGRDPLAWGSIHHHLGIALQALGARESGTARLEEAVAAYRGALEEVTSERAPHLHDIATENLDGALAQIARHARAVT